MRYLTFHTESSKSSVLQLEVLQPGPNISDTQWQDVASGYHIKQHGPEMSLRDNCLLNK